MACCPSCKRSYDAPGGAACAHPVCSMLAECSRIKSQHIETLPGSELRIEPQVKRAGEEDTDDRKKNRSEWPQAEFDARVKAQTAELFSEYSNERYLTIFFSSVNRNEFRTSWQTAFLNTDKYQASDANLTTDNATKINAAVTAVWSIYIEDAGLERTRVETLVATTLRRLDAAEDRMLTGQVPPSDLFDRVMAFEPKEHLTAEFGQQLQARWGPINEKRSLLLSIDPLGVYPFFVAVGNLYRSLLVAAPDILSPVSAEDRALAFLRDVTSGSATTAMLRENMSRGLRLGDERTGRILAGLNTISAAGAPERIPGLSARLVSGLAEAYEEVRLQRYNELADRLRKPLFKEIRRRAKSDGRATVDQLIDTVVRPFFDTPAGSVGRSLPNEDVQEIVSDSIQLYSAVASLKKKPPVFGESGTLDVTSLATPEELAQRDTAKVVASADPELAREADVPIKTVAKKGGKASKLRAAFLEQFDTEMRIDGSYRRIKDMQVDALSRSFEDETSEARRTAAAVGIPAERYDEAIIKLAPYLAGKIIAGAKKIAKEITKDEREATLAKKKEEREAEKARLRMERKAEADAKRAEQLQAKAAEDAAKDARVRTFLEQVQAWPDEINTFINNPAEHKAETRRAISSYREVANAGGDREEFDRLLEIPTDTPLGSGPHKLAWSLLEASALGSARRRKAVDDILATLNFESAQSNMLTYGLPDNIVYDAYLDGMVALNKLEHRTQLDYDHPRPVLDPVATAKVMYKKRTQVLTNEYPTEFLKKSAPGREEQIKADLVRIAEASVPIIEVMISEKEASPADRFIGVKKLRQLETDINTSLAALSKGRIPTDPIEWAYVRTQHDGSKAFEAMLLRDFTTYDSLKAEAYTGVSASRLNAHVPRYLTTMPPSLLETPYGQTIRSAIQRVWIAFRRAKGHVAPSKLSVLLSKLEKVEQAERRFVTANTAVQEAKNARDKALKEIGGTPAAVETPAPPVHTPPVRKRMAPTLVSTAAPVPSLPVVVARLPVDRKERAPSDIESDYDDEQWKKTTVPADPVKAKELQDFDKVAKEELKQTTLGEFDDDSDEEDADFDPTLGDKEDEDVAPPPIVATPVLSLAQRSKNQGKKKGGTLLARALRRAEKKSERLEGFVVDDSKEDEPGPEMSEEFSAAWWAGKTTPAPAPATSDITRDLLEWNM